MLTYHESLSPLPCSVCEHTLIAPPQDETVSRTEGPSDVHPSELLIPGTPHMQAVPLPSSTPSASSQNSEGGIFPLRILQHLSTAQTDILGSIVFTTPIHVHTPVAHIGVVHSDSPRERVNAVELIHFLQVMYSRMNPRANFLAEMSFTQHVALSSSATENQNWSTSGQRSEDISIGYDLLLGNDEVWGLETMSFEGYGVVHLAGQ